MFLDIALAFLAHVVPSRAQTRQECEKSLMNVFSLAGELLKPSANAPVKSFEAYTELLARVKQVTFESIDRNIGILGAPDYCVERIRAYQQEYH